MTEGIRTDRSTRVGLFLFCLVLIAVLSATTAPTTAEARQTATTITVRAVAHDAKIIGSNVGGARIVIRELPSRRVLADGIQEGSTGDTGLILTNPPPRHEPVYDTEGAAHFTTELMLDGPTMVEIEAIGPLGNPEATTRSTKQMLLMPGEDVTGEGVIIELNGFTVDWLAPSAVEEHPVGEAFTVRARVTMLCGCPTEPGGLWDSNDIEVRARVYRDGERVADEVMQYSGQTSIYETQLSPEGPGEYRIEVTAADAAHANFGRAERTLLVR